MIKLDLDLDAMREAVRRLVSGGTEVWEALDKVVDKACEGHIVPAQVKLTIRDSVYDPILKERLREFTHPRKGRMVVSGRRHGKEDREQIDFKMLQLPPRDR